MNGVNPLAHLSDDELVAQHSQQAVNNHFLSEMLRRHKKGSADLGDKVWWLNRWLLAFTVAIFLLTGALVWTTFHDRSQATRGAWVLWKEVPGGSGRGSLDTGMEIAFQAKADCEQQLKARIQLLAGTDPRTSDPTPFLACLPDTVDPRGPKGK